MLQTVDCQPAQTSRLPVFGRRPVSWPEKEDNWYYLQFLPIGQALLDLDGSLLSCLKSSQTA